VARTPIRIAFALLELPGAGADTALVCAGAEPALDELLVLLFEPHPAAATAATEATATSALRPSPRLRHDL
jgi:hypothetical protein